MKMKKLLLASCAFLLVGAAHVSTAVSAPECPKPRRFSGGCIQVITYAKNPETGTCCEYPNPCSAPEGWATYFTLAECQAAG